MQATEISVLAILVATNGEEWLPGAITGLTAQTHERLEVIAVDNSSTDGSSDLLAKAFGANALVLERRVGYGRAIAAALKVAIDRGTKADAFLLIHDDTALDPGAIDALCEALFSSDDIGIVGGKIMEWDEPTVLQEVGMSTDRYGRLFGGLERGEIDQGQHDGTRDVLFVTSAMMLVRRTLIERIGLFDLRYVALRDDLDLCWRTWLAGHRVVVTSDAQARHAAAAVRGRRDAMVSGATRYFGERNLIATLVKNYSTRRLVLVLPLVAAQSLLSALISFIRGRRGQARQLFGALQWNVVHAPSSLRARRRARRHHAGSDATVFALMVRGAPRVRGYVERALESVVGDPAAGIEETELGAVHEETAKKTLLGFIRTHPGATAATILLLVILAGTRRLFGSGGLAGAGLYPFPAGGAFFREFFSGWRSAGVAGAHPPGLAMLLLGLLSFVSVGSAWLAARVLVLGLLPLGGVLASRTAAHLGLGRVGRIAAGVIYGSSPLALAAFSKGRLPELILIAAAPGLLLPLLRSAGVTHPVPLSPDSDPLRVPSEWRSIAGGMSALAVAGAFSPYALPFVFGAGIAVAFGAWMAGAPRPLAAIRAGAIIAGGAAVLLFPWSVELIRHTSPIAMGGTAQAAPMLDLLRLAPDGAPNAIFAWAFPVAAVFGILFGLRRERSMVTVTATMSAIAAALAWGAGRVSFLAPRPALPLVGAAIGIALLAGLGVESLGPALRGRTFGVLHGGVAAATAFLLAALVVHAGWMGRGRFDGLGPTGDVAPSFVAADQASTGAFRLLWVGSRPGSRGRSDAVAVDLTDADGETMLSYGVRRDGPFERFAHEAIRSMLAGRTDLGGHLLAPLGVRQILIRPGASAGLRAAFGRQVDLRFRQTFRGAALFDNVAWLPIAAPLAPTDPWKAATAGSDLFVTAAGVQRTGEPLRGLDRTGPASFKGALDARASVLYLAEPFDPRWQLRTSLGRAAPHQAFGLGTAFDVPLGTLNIPGGAVLPGVSIEWRGNRSNTALLLIQLVLWIGLASWWSRRAALERGER